VANERYSARVSRFRPKLLRMINASGTLPAFSDVALSANGLATALDSAGMVSIAGPDGRLIHVNDAFVKTSQRSREELIGQDLSVLSPGQPDLWAEILASLRQHRAWHGHIENCAKDGSSYWADTIILPLLGIDQKLAGYLSIQRELAKPEPDIASLQARSDLLNTVTQGFPGGLTVFDRDLGLLLMNEKQRELLEYPRDLFRNGLPSLEEDRKSVV
jgi:PAS domain S-box-containing protein